MAECRRGGNGCGFFVFVWNERPPPKEILFPFEGVFLWEGEYTGREVWQKLRRGGGIHQVGGYDPPPFCGGRHCRLGSAICTQGGKAGKADEAGT